MIGWVEPVFKPMGVTTPVPHSCNSLVTFLFYLAVLKNNILLAFMMTFSTHFYCALAIFTLSPSPGPIPLVPILFPYSLHSTFFLFFKGLKCILIS
jgi:hypothetical protein